MQCPGSTEAAYVAPAGSSVAWCWNLLPDRSNGFDIVTYDGDGNTSNREISHSLGKTPELMIVKNRAATSWQVYHVKTDETNPEDYVLWMDTNYSRTAEVVWGNTKPAADKFTVRYEGGPRTNGPLGSKFVAYLWTSIPNYSSIGSYQGNGSDDGPMIYTGHSVAWVMTKRADGAEDWSIVDNARSISNPAYQNLRPNQANGEGAGIGSNDIDFLSNGFKLRNSTNRFNGSGSTYIYAAFASCPFQSPATAR